MHMVGGQGLRWNVGGVVGLVGLPVIANEVAGLFLLLVAYC